MKFIGIIFILLTNTICIGQTQHYFSPNESIDTVYSNMGEFLTIFYSNSDGCDKTIIIDESGFPIRQIWFFKGDKLAELSLSPNGERFLQTFQINTTLNCAVELKFNGNNELVEESYSFTDSSMQKQIISFKTSRDGMRLPAQID